MAEPEDTYPKIYHNVNVKAQIVHNAAQAEQLGSSWVELDLAGQGLALTPAPPEP
jgi:hypothetical protein